MKCAAVVIVCAAGLLPAARAADPGDLDKLQGRWNVESFDYDGAAVPAMAGATRDFAGDKYTLTPKAGESYTGTVKLEATTTPKQIDLVLPDRTLKGIYEIDGDKLKIAYVLEGDARPTEFASKPGSGVVLVVHKKAG